MVGIKSRANNPLIKPYTCSECGLRWYDGRTTCRHLILVEELRAGLGAIPQFSKDRELVKA